MWYTLLPRPTLKGVWLIQNSVITASSITIYSFLVTNQIKMPPTRERCKIAIEGFIVRWIAKNRKKMQSSEFLSTEQGDQEDYTMFWKMTLERPCLWDLNGMLPCVLGSWKDDMRDWDARAGRSRWWCQTSCGTELHTWRECMHSWSWQSCNRSLTELLVDFMSDERIHLLSQRSMSNRRGTYLWNLLWANTFGKTVLHPFPWVLCIHVVFHDTSQAMPHAVPPQMHRQHQPQTELWSLDCSQSIHRSCSELYKQAVMTDPTEKISSRHHHLQTGIPRMTLTRLVMYLILQVSSCLSPSCLCYFYSRLPTVEVLLLTMMKMT